MKVKAFAISGLLTVFSIVQVWSSNLDFDDQNTKANLIKLPSPKILEENIEKILGNTHFLEKTQLHIQLGGTSKSLDEIDLAIDSAICNYINNIKKNNVLLKLVITLEKVMYGSKLSLRRAILEPGQIS